MPNTTANKIVIVRHAHRDTTVRSADNGLSEKGHEQVRELVKALENEKLPWAKLFFSSPKLRCQETLGPLAEKAKQTLTTEKLLDEQEPGESSKDFSQRIQKLADKLNSLSENVYVSSHGDVIPELIQNLTGYWVDLKKAQAAVLERSTDNKWIIR